jgi:hypothetical protein
MIQATSAQAFANNTLTNVAFDASAGLAACIDLVNDRLLVPRDGLYRVDGCCSWTANGTGYRRQGITYHPSAGGGDAYVGVNDSVATSAISQSCPIVSKLVQCVAGDYFYMRAQQTSGGSLNSYVGLLGVFMSIQWVKP